MILCKPCERCGSLRMEQAAEECRVCAAFEKAEASLMGLVEAMQSEIATLKSEREAAVHALRNIRLYALKHRHLCYDEIHTIVRFCAEGGVEGTILRDEP